MAAKRVTYSESTLTDRYQTTIPEPVRKALDLNKRDKICYNLGPDGKVWLSRVRQAESDPVIEKFLSFLAQDMESNPQRLQSISSELVDRARSLVSDVELDLNAPLLDEDE